MKRNRFRLDTVMRVRQIQENIEMGRLTKARLDVALAEQRQTETIEAYTRATQPDGRAVSSNEFLSARTKFERLGDQVVNAAHDVSSAKGEAQLRHHDWSIAAQRVSALDRLRDRHHELHQSELAAEEILDADERTTQRRFHATRSLSTPARAGSEPVATTTSTPPNGKAPRPTHQVA